MAEHKHEWVFDGIDMFDCIHDDCNERMDMDEAEKRLNATECFSAADARELNGIIYGEWCASEESLLSYISKLEGECDPASPTSS